jgi:hypothetical protein
MMVSGDQSVRWPLFGQVYQPRMVDGGEWGPVGTLAPVWPSALALDCG